MNQTTKTKIAWVLIAIFIALFGAALVYSNAGADGFFPENCNWLNNCDTFGDMEDFQVTNLGKEGILVEGTVPAGIDLAGTGNPVEIIVTTGDVYTKCANTGGVTNVTGDVLYRGNVKPGYFSVILPLAYGEYNITVYMGQSVCANCPNAEVFQVEVKDKQCENTSEAQITLVGDYPCYSPVVDKSLLTFKEAGYGYNKLPYWFQDMVDAGWCDLVDRTDCEGGEIADVYWVDEKSPREQWSMKDINSCSEPIPACTACP